VDRLRHRDEVAAGIRQAAGLAGRGAVFDARMALRLVDLGDRQVGGTTRWKCRASGTAAWPLPQPTSQASSRPGARSASQENSASG
jgi:hypothetical protein